MKLYFNCQNKFAGLGFFATAALLTIVTAAWGARRPGPPRTLRLSGVDAQRGRTLWHSDDAVAGADLTEPVSGPGEDGEQLLFFTRREGGTANLWRARLASPEKGESNLDTRKARETVLEATPVTHLMAPFFASGAAVLEGGRSLLCVTNLGLAAADVGAGHSCIARIDLRNGKISPLTEAYAIVSGPVIAPGGKRFAFAAQSGGLPAIMVAALRGGFTQRPLEMADSPCWLDADTLIYNNLRPGRRGLYKVTVTASEGEGGGVIKVGAAHLLWQRAGQACASADGRRLCVMARPGNGAGDDAAPSRLYLLAPDGSGARAIGATEGAATPAFSSDDSMLFYDAPRPRDGLRRSEPVTGPAAGPTLTEGPDERASAAAPQRTLWMVPMLRTAPSASLVSLRTAPLGTPAAPGAAAAVDLIGSVYAEGGAPAQMQLEWGEGETPAHWYAIPVANGVYNNAVLARWTPPHEHGEYSFRLTVVDADADSNQSMLTVSLPLPPADSPPTPPVFSRMPQSHPAAPAAPEVEPEAPTIDNSLPVPWAVPPAAGPPPTPARKMSPAASRHTPRRNSRSARPPAAKAPTLQKALPAMGSSTGPLPMPALPPAPQSEAPEQETPAPAAPGADAPKATASAESAQAAAREAAQVAAAHRAAAARAAAAADRAAMARAITARAAAAAAEAKTAAAKAAAAAAVAKAAAAPSVNEAKGPADAADAPEPATAAEPAAAPAAAEAQRPGDAAVLTISGVPLSMKLGQVAPLVAQARNIGGNGWKVDRDGPVRLLVYWRDLNSGLRTHWFVRWLHSDVPPGGSTEIKFDLAAPSRMGHYQLRFCLVRAPGGHYQAPPISQQTMPGEFGVAATTMDVD